MERRGSGFKKIINAYETQQNYKESLKPIFNSFNNDFILTLFNLNYSANVPQDDAVNGTVNNTMKLSANETKVYELLKKDNSINIEQIVATSKISRRTVIRILNNLKNNNIIKGISKKPHLKLI